MLNTRQFASPAMDASSLSRSGNPNRLNNLTKRRRTIWTVALVFSVLGAVAPIFSQTYQLRLYNVDDTLSATISNSAYTNLQILIKNYYEDSGLVDITTYVRPGPNTIQISLFNYGGGYAYGYQFAADNVIKDSATCGTVGVIGCNNNDLGHQNEVAYTHTIPFNATASSGGQTANTNRRTLPVDLSNSCYSNRFDQGDGFQCTRFAWGRACEKLGVKLAFTDESKGGLDAGDQWWTRINNFSKGQAPLPNSLAVWSDGNGGGHVAFVEEISNGNITLSEANYYSSTSGHSYDGFHSIPLTSMTNRGGFKLLGYIYTSPYEGYMDNNSSACPTSVSGWVADWTQLNTSLNVQVFDNETYLGTMYANAWRGDVGSYLKDNGNHAFSYPLPNSVLDGNQHTIWARVAGTYTDLINSQTVSCNNTPSNRVGNLQLSFSPTIALPFHSSDCVGTNYQYTLSGTETNGVGINLSNLSLSEGWSWQLPIFGIPNKVNAFGNFQTPMSWCRGPGTSTWTITGTDDMGKSVTATANITFALQ